MFYSTTRLLKPKNCLQQLNFLLKYSITNNMSKPKVYVTRGDVPVAAINLLKENCEVTIWPGTEPVPQDELIKNVNCIDALFCLLTDKIDKQVLDNAPNLKIVSTMSVGYDHIDLEEIKKRNIKVGYTPGILTDATAELTVALLLATSRRLLEANEQLRTGGWKAWSPLWMCGPGLSNKTIGIVGFGRIGQQVAQRLKAFNVAKIIFHSRSDYTQEAARLGATKVDFDTLLAESDFVIATCALTPETKGMFSERVFEKMKRSAIFVNTSRGGVVNQHDLIKALENNTILAAGLDVMDPEPLPLTSPLLKLKNCVLLPHIGSATMETRQQMALMTAKNILTYLDGKEMPAALKLS